ncbi:MAG: ATP synthase subunit I [Alphaproteobacteria bacterium]
MNGLLPLEIAAAALVGLALGAAYFGLLHRAVAALTATAGGVTAMFGLGLLRVALAVAVFWLLARWGGGALLAGAGGFTAAGLLARRLAGPR